MRPAEPDPGIIAAVTDQTTETTEPVQPAQTPANSPDLPPDPEAYDAPRAAQARARGLAAPYIAGGRDPQPEAGRREERFYLGILLAMVVVLVLSGFVIGIISKLLGA
jgi:hypothetical protein